MTDWLEELRREKQEAIERSQSQKHDTQNAAAERLASEQQRLATLIQTIGIESLMQQFVDEVLRDHPLFVDPALNRTVSSRDAASSLAREEREGAPWSGPVAGNPLPAELALGDGRVVSRVDWRVHLNQRGSHGAELQANDLVVTATAQALLVNHEALAAPSADKFKTALVAAFRQVTQPGLAPGVHRSRRRHHAWHNRLWESFFPANQPTRIYIVLILFVMLLLVLIISVYSANLGS